MTKQTKKSDFDEALALKLQEYRNEDVIDARTFFFLDDDADETSEVNWAPFSGTSLDFKCEMTQATYNVPNTRLARPVPKGRGVPDAFIVNMKTMDVLDAVSSDWYHIVDNERLHNATLAGLEAALPPSFLKNHEMHQYAGRNGAFSQCIIDIPELNFEVRNGTGSTTLSLVAAWKNDLKLSTQVSIMARDQETGNLINLGVASTKAQRHKPSFDEQPIMDHIREWIDVRFAERIDQLQDMMKTSVTFEQVDLALSMGNGRLLSDAEAIKIRDHIFAEEIEWYGKSKFSVMSGLATFCTDEDAFPVRNSDTQDNIAETLASRQGQVAKLVMTHFFYGKDKS